MTMVNTQYGPFENVVGLDKYPSGNPASFIFSQRVNIKTPVGDIIPQYFVDDHGRRVLKPVFFYDNGKIKKAPLQEAAVIETKYGKISAELVMFYDDESLKKLFPLNGKLSGYWSEKNEYALAQDLDLELPFGTVKAKIINLFFYKSGKIKSITLWPEETIETQTPAGPMGVRIGIAFYEDGSIKSVEPVKPVLVETKIGKITAYDNDPEGITGDINSLQFDNNGEVTALKTINNIVMVKQASKEPVKYTPSEKESLCNEQSTVTVPLQIEFINGKIRFNKSTSDEYEFSENQFEVMAYTKKTANPFYVCS